MKPSYSAVVREGGWVQMFSRTGASLKIKTCETAISVHECSSKQINVEYYEEDLKLNFVRKSEGAQNMLNMYGKIKILTKFDQDVAKTWQTILNFHEKPKT